MCFTAKYIGLIIIATNEINKTREAGINESKRL